MARTRLAAACVALLAVTAGCGGVFGGEATPTRDPYEVAPTPTRTATPAVTATTATATPTTPTEADSASFLVDPPRRAPPELRAVVANHTAALRAAGNFTVVRRRATGRAVGPLTGETVGWAMADLDAGRFASGPPPDAGEFVVRTYQNGSGVFRRVGRGANATFRTVTGRATLTPRRLVRANLWYVANFSVAFAFERAGTATFDGERMRRYVAGDPGAFRGVEQRVRNVTAFTATVLVDDRGIVRKFTYEIRGELYAGAGYAERATVAFRDVGTTTVPWPDGIANATGP